MDNRILAAIIIAVAGVDIVGSFAAMFLIEQEEQRKHEEYVKPMNEDYERDWNAMQKK